MLFRRDGIFGCNGDRFKLRNEKLHIAGSLPFRFLHLTGYSKRRFLRKFISKRVCSFVHGILHDDALAQPRAIAQNEKLYFPAGALIRKPPT